MERSVVRRETYPQALQENPTEVAAAFSHFLNTIPAGIVPLRSVNTCGTSEPACGLSSNTWMLTFCLSSGSKTTVTLLGRLKLK